MKKKYILLGLLAFLGLSQFVKIDKSNPPVDIAKDFVGIEKPSEAISQRLATTCYDCHSHTTAYPWYTDVAPVSWWVKRHINLGREKLNFSLWSEYSAKEKSHKIDECISYTEKKWMPLGSYTWMHREAKMTDEDRAALVTYFKSLK